MRNVPWPVDLVLRPDETLIRHDPAYTSLTIGGRRHWGRSHMILTTERIAFAAPPKLRYHKLRMLSWLTRHGAYYYLHANPGAKEIELSRIQQIHAWRPYLSGPPMIVTLDEKDGDRFELLDDWEIYPFRPGLTYGELFAPMERRRDHFEAVEAAWKAVMQLQTIFPASAGA